MASCFFLLRQFEDVLLYLNSIKVCMCVFVCVCVWVWVCVGGWVGVGVMNR